VSDPSNAPPRLGAGQIEIWKKIVDVQQHFNDLELRVRNFALIVTGAFLGLGGCAIKDGGTVYFFGIEVSLAGLVVMTAILPLAPSISWIDFGTIVFWMGRSWRALRRRKPSKILGIRSIWDQKSRRSARLPYG
jgi:hypothetical protein